jgi:diguanylate cyclase (GGDEF)-like protein
MFSGATEPVVPLRGHVLLIVDDSVTTRVAIRQALEPTGLFAHYLEATDGQEALTLLAEKAVDIVLCDIVMPGIDGFTFLQKKAQAGFQDIPVLMLTGQESVEKKVAGLDLGASDYVTKPFAKDELIARVKVHLKLKLLQDRLREASITDFLTRRFNRRHFMELFYAELERSKCHGQPLSLLILDIDHFKRVNDTLGHTAGDHILVQVATRVRENVRAEDVVGRYGGEEFVILLPQIGPEGGMIAAEKVRQAVASTPFGDKVATTVTISVGVVSYDGRRPTTATIDTLLMLADRALYAAKEKGRNRVEVAVMPF